MVDEVQATPATPTPEVAVVAATPAPTTVNPIVVFLGTIWSKIKKVAQEIENKVIFLWKVIWGKIEAIDTAVNSLITSLGTLKAGLIILACWGIYLLFVKGILTASTTVIAALIQSIPTIIITALVAVTVIEIVKIFKK
jgi:hypothetical protein